MENARDLLPRGDVRKTSLDLNKGSSATSCPPCDKMHFLYACPGFKALSVADRVDLLRTERRCYNCLSSNHYVGKCPSAQRCSKCQGKHHTLLHRANRRPSDSSKPSLHSARGPLPLRKPSPEETSHLVLGLGACMLFKMARVQVLASSNRSRVVRALLDPGSCIALITDSLARYLRLRRTAASIILRGAGDHEMGTYPVVRISIRSKTNLGPVFNTCAAVLPTLAQYQLPRRGVKSADWHHLADVDFIESDPIDILIGIDVLFQTRRPEERQGLPSVQVMEPICFGWDVSGPTDAPVSSVRVHHVASEFRLDEALRRFWETENVPHTEDEPHNEEQRCESHFARTHSRTKTGRYMVRLPFRQPPVSIGETRVAALARLYALERRFRVDPGLAEEYRSFLKEYQELGYMTRLNSDSTDSFRNYIPHHPVVRVSSTTITTTRFRVVFDTSSRGSGGRSLDDCLIGGPKLRQSLPAILVRWRSFRFVYTADIKKMFRQILVHPQDQQYQLILWREQPTLPVEEFRLQTVIDGTSSAPYLARRVLRQLAEDNGGRFPLALPVLRDQLYADNFLFGASSGSELINVRDQLIALLGEGGFRLRKWTSNGSLLLTDIDAEDRGLAGPRTLFPDEELSVLGLQWNPLHDSFFYKFEVPSTVPTTKRGILSLIARLFDPLGWITPVLVRTKIFMQRLQQSDCAWDEPIPSHLYSEWLDYYRGLSDLSAVSIPRYIPGSEGSSIELHGFAKASQSAYAAATYCRQILNTGEVVTFLVAAKSKVSLVKPMTIPRLELCAALLLAQLIDFVRSSRPAVRWDVRCWTDSTITLWWLRKSPSEFRTFVANRIAAIHRLLPEAQWRHVSTKDNPANCASCGLLPRQIASHSLWWTGPPWLQEPEHSWPAANRVPDSDIPTETLGPGCALSYWLRTIQAECFPSELSCLHRDLPVPPTSPLFSLTPYLDSESLLRSVPPAWFQRSDLSETARNPIILGVRVLLKLIVRHAHLRTLHGGTSLTLAELRREYWIVRARTQVRAAIHRCASCARATARVPIRTMGDLPAQRVTFAPRSSFEHTAVYYAGPCLVRVFFCCSQRLQKCYVAVFVCLMVKAVHLELVSDYTSSAFLDAFQRFVFRRGIPAAMYFENGTAFRGVDRELARSFRQAVRDETVAARFANLNITWHFSPPADLRFGELWEVAVKSLKHHLRRCVGPHPLSFEEFTTLLCHIEACLYSRPICEATDAIEDYRAVTPGHLLKDTPPNAIPSDSCAKTGENKLTRWNFVRRLNASVCLRWRRDYLHGLYQRPKWRHVQELARVGQLVLLRDPDLPPCEWALGRIIECHSGADGLVRVVTVRTARTTLKRPTAQLCFLPVPIKQAAENSVVSLEN